MPARKFGKATKSCRLCGSHERMIGKYELNVCGRCFREVAPQLGFKKYS